MGVALSNEIQWGMVEGVESIFTVGLKGMATQRDIRYFVPIVIYVRK